jgi:hypothetical protein
MLISMNQIGRQRCVNTLISNNISCVLNVLENSTKRFILYVLHVGKWNVDNVMLEYPGEQIKNPIALIVAMKREMQFMSGALCIDFMGNLNILAQHR